MRKYTDDEMKKYWMARCPDCGWKGLSIDCDGFDAIPESGDYEDGRCPKCGGIVDGEDEEPKQYLLWVFRWITQCLVRKKSAK